MHITVFHDAWHDRILQLNPTILRLTAATTAPYHYYRRGCLMLDCFRRQFGTVCFRHEKEELCTSSFTQGVFEFYFLNGVWSFRVKST